jgi:spoIIIJ-associated protein
VAKQVEVEGATVKEAIDKAKEQLGVTRDEIEVKVLAEENKGLFGMKGSRGAKIRVTLKKNAEK